MYLGILSTIGNHQVREECVKSFVRINLYHWINLRLKVAATCKGFFHFDVVVVFYGIYNNMSSNS